MISINDFQNEVHTFQTFDRAEADALAKKYNDAGIEENQTATVMKFPGLGYCLMISKASDAVAKWGLNEK